MPLNVASQRSPWGKPETSSTSFHQARCPRLFFLLDGIIDKVEMPSGESDQSPMHKVTSELRCLRLENRVAVGSRRVPPVNNGI